MPECDCSLPAVFYLDCFTVNFHVAPLTVEKILVRMVGIGFEHEQIGLVGAERSQTPGDILCKAYQNNGTACNSDTAGIKCLTTDVKFVKQRWITDRRLRVANEYG